MVVVSDWLPEPPRGAVSTHSDTCIIHKITGVGSVVYSCTSLTCVRLGVGKGLDSKYLKLSVSCGLCPNSFNSAFVSLTAAKDNMEMNGSGCIPI